MVTAALLFSEDLKMLAPCALPICPGEEEVDGETVVPGHGGRQAVLDGLGPWEWDTSPMGF